MSGLLSGALLFIAGVAIVVWQRAVPELVAAGLTAAAILVPYYTLH